MSVSGQIDKILRKKDKKLQLIADDIAAAVKDKLKENLEKNWYSTYSPKSYFRTWDLFDSVTAEVTHDGRCNYYIQVYFDSAKISSVQNGSGWNSHMGFDGQSFKSGLVSLIEHGMIGSKYNPRNGNSAHMIEFTQEWANQYARQLLKSRL